MKKIFTLLFCITAMSFACNAQDLTPVQDCIQYLLAHNSSNQVLIASNANANMDANHDGVINIHDVTFMINENLKAAQVKQEGRAPARNDSDVKKLIHEVLESETDTPNINDVTDAINEKLR